MPIYLHASCAIVSEKKMFCSYQELTVTVPVLSSAIKKLCVPDLSEA
ncbi:hypothetical protein SDC9_121535 [bioreactor metagenome]|uniref:Uncharacterized protein n=1 Tax=bioreactor metagenome TaxID=1076179 RepID=A0A645CC83_9ZZZZ